MCIMQHLYTNFTVLKHKLQNIYWLKQNNLKVNFLFVVAGGRSRLHLIDLGSSSKSKDPDNVSLSLSALGNVIMALLNGQRHVPHR